MIRVPTIGNSGGIVLLWDDSQLDVDEITTSNQEIHTMIKVSTSNFSWMISCIYATCHDPALWAMPRAQMGPPNATTKPDYK